MATVQLQPHFQEFSRCLNSNEVRYLLIGGHAVGYPGWGRNSNAIDFCVIDCWIAGDGDNQVRAASTFRQLAFPHAGLGSGVPPLRIEMRRTVSGITSEDA